MNRNDERGRRAESPEDRRESGRPGGGAGRRDEVGGSGVHPASAGDAPRDAEIRTPAAWGQGERGAAGYEDAGDSELHFSEAELRAAGVDQAGVDSVETPPITGLPAEPEREQENPATDRLLAREVRIPLGKVPLRGDLTVPADASGIVLFAHGSGSSRLSPRNQAVARDLQDAGLGTLLFDLLSTEEEEIDRQTAHLRFDIDLLGERLTGAAEWAAEQPELRELPIGFFGASTGAAAALVAAARLPDLAKAVVSRGGRPDLARDALRAVKAPTLLIVGERDPTVIGMNREAFELLDVEKKMEIVEGATHLFEEPGKLEEVARLASDWFTRFLRRRRRDRGW